MDAKLRKPKTTIASNLIAVFILLFSSSIWAIENNVSVNQINGKIIYTIKINQISLNNVQDEQIATLKAKSKLLQFFKQKNPNIKGLTLSHFKLEKSVLKNKIRYFTFIIDEENIKPYS